MNINDFGELLYGTTPAPTPEQYAAARRYVAANAPELADMIFGGDL